MSSFLEKLKKGMGVEASIEEEADEDVFEKDSEVEKEFEEEEEPEVEEKKEEKPKRPRRTVKPKKIEVKKEEPEKEDEESLNKEQEVEEESIKEEKVEIETKKEKWFEPEGQLAVDVYQTDKDLIIESAIAGIKPEELDISIENDRVFIKGERVQSAEEKDKNYFYQECYWGLFSRQIILPVEVDPSRAQAEMKQGVLIIRIPKIEREKKRKIEVRG